eukprot:7390142-Prymnesium_polylepis.1
MLDVRIALPVGEPNAKRVDLLTERLVIKVSRPRVVADGCDLWRERRGSGNRVQSRCPAGHG